MKEQEPIHPAMARIYKAMASGGWIAGEHKQTAVARALNTSSQAVRNWELRGPSKAARLECQKAFGINATWIESGEGPVFFVEDEATGKKPPVAAQPDPDANTEPGPDLKPTRDVPVVGEVKGGDDGYLEELEYPCGHGEGLIEWPTSDENAYALRVRGDSMFPRYRAGEFVIVEPSVQAPLGEDVVVCLTDGRKMLKVLNWIRDGEVQLLSVNNGFAPLTIPQGSIESIQYAAGRAPRSALKKL